MTFFSLLLLFVCLVFLRFGNSNKLRHASSNVISHWIIAPSTASSSCLVSVVASLIFSGVFFFVQRGCQSWQKKNKTIYMMTWQPNLTATCTWAICNIFFLLSVWCGNSLIPNLLLRYSVFITYSFNCDGKTVANKQQQQHRAAIKMYSVASSAVSQMILTSWNVILNCIYYTCPFLLRWWMKSSNTTVGLRFPS